MADMSQYTIPRNTPVVTLDCQEAFGGLTDQEKLYAHYIAHACFTGSLVVLFQVNLVCKLDIYHCVYVKLVLAATFETV
jgi:hypothetical protein